MADNTTLNTGTGGDAIRDLDRSGAGVKTQVVQLDMGGSAANAEVLVEAGQQEKSASLPVVLAKEQDTTELQGYLLLVHREQLRYLKKIAFMLSAATGIALDDDDVSPLIED